MNLAGTRWIDMLRMTSKAEPVHTDGTNFSHRYFSRRGREKPCTQCLTTIFGQTLPYLLGLLHAQWEPLLFHKSVASKYFSFHLNSFLNTSHTRNVFAVVSLPKILIGFFQSPSSFKNFIVLF